MSFSQYLRKPRYTAEQYLHMLRKLLPNGRSWGFFAGDTSAILQDTYTEEETVQDVYTGEDDTLYDTTEGVTNEASTPFGIWLSTVSSEFARVEEKAYDLVKEMVPGLATELLPEWLYITVRDQFEAELIGDDLDAQRALAHSKIFTESQVTTAQWFVDYADSLGFEIEVNEDPYFGVPFRVGESRCGEPLASVGAIFFVEINVLSLSPTVSNDLLVGLFEQAKPAHVLFIWIWP